MQREQIIAALLSCRTVEACEKALDLAEEWQRDHGFDFDMAAVAEQAVMVLSALGGSPTKEVRPHVQDQ